MNTKCVYKQLRSFWCYFLRSVHGFSSYPGSLFLLPISPVLLVVQRYTNVGCWDESFLAVRPSDAGPSIPLVLLYNRELLALRHGNRTFIRR